MLPEKIITKIMENDLDGDMVQALYGAFLHGHPIERLKPLLESKDPDIRGTGAFLANELGCRCQSLVNVVAKLLDDPSAQIRSDAIHALRSCTTWRDKEVQGKVILALNDPKPFVHRAVIFFILMKNNNIGINEAAKLAPGTIFEEISSMVGNSSVISNTILNTLVNHENPLAQRFGAGMAMRARSIIDAELMEIANSVNDHEASQMLAYIRGKPKPVGTRLAYLDFDIENSSEELILDDFIDYVTTKQSTKIIPKLMKMSKGVFYPAHQFIPKTQGNFYDISMCWCDDAVEPIKDHKMVNLIFQDTKNFNFRHAVFNLDI